MLRYSIIQRSFSTSTILWASRKTLLQKINSVPTNEYDLGIGKSTSLFFKWLISNPTNTLRNYQDSLLQSLKFNQSVKVSTEKVAGISEIRLLNPNAKIETPTLMIHGHAASGIFYHRNFENLSTHFQKLYAIDLPDIGLSDKKPLNVEPTSAIVKLKESENGELEYSIQQDILKNSKSVKKVEDYYIESLETWRIAHGVKKINIIAHSFGGYLSFKYSLRYPEHVKNLVLVSPGGVERSIFSIHNNYQSGIVLNDSSSSHYYRPPFIPPIVSKYGFTLAKMMGPFGVRLIAKYLSIRFSRGAPENKDQVSLLLKYAINLFYQNNNSFDALKVVLNGQILALSPILDNLESFKVPVYFMYGKHDWMNGNAGLAAALELGPGLAKFSIVDNAGHNVFLDNPTDFDDKIVKYLREK